MDRSARSERNMLVPLITYCSEVEVIQFVVKSAHNLITRYVRVKVIL